MKTITLTLTPAFGRDYKSKKALLDDWNRGDVDFIVQPRGCYVNKNQAGQIKSDGYARIQFRYKA